MIASFTDQDAIRGVCVEQLFEYFLSELET